MSGLVHPDQHVRNATQNSLCRAVNRNNKQLERLWQRVRSILGIIILDGWPIGLLRRSGSRESIHQNVQTTVDFKHGSLRYDDPMPPRTTEESYRPRVSDRTMVGNSAIVMLVSFKKRMGAVTTGKWNHREEEESHRFV